MATLTQLVQRHEVLRTVFPNRQGEPWQLVQPAEPVAMPVVDLRELGMDRATEAARDLARREAQQSFDLLRGPLLRVRLVRLSGAEHVVLLTMHHIISDGWSSGVLVREVVTLYDAQRQGQRRPLPPLAMQYGDYAAWQQEWLRDQELERQLSYWRRQLQDWKGLELPTDRPRPAVQTFRGSVERFHLGAELSRKLRELSRRASVTLFMTLLGSFQALLARYSGQSDIAVGTPIANRNRQEWEELIGFFVNTLVLRTEVRREDSFLQLLGRVRETALGAYVHQDLPFEQLVEQLEPERDLSRQPLFQVMLALQNAPYGELQLEGLRVAPLEFEAGTGQGRSGGAAGRRQSGFSRGRGIQHGPV